MSPFRLNPRTGALLLALSALVIACTKVPITGRKQYNLIPEKLMIGLGKSQYSSTLSKHKLQRKGEDNQVLQRVGKRISKVAKRSDYDWQYSLIKDDTINAWCLPGGYIGFYTGILPTLKHEAGMAFVMGHEVGHATARHGSERLSQHLSVLGGMVGLYAILEGKTKLKTEQKVLIVGALGLATEVGVILPFSRMHESEADAIGVMYMAEAGYPPKEAKAVWDRMAQNTGKSVIPVFLSTHPNHEQRKKTIDKWLPQAQKRYQRNKLDRETTNGLW
ncbi:MAG: M48 family metallopeptidase [Alphaproteobacteria bacterium]|nr:M48 family metallopeptidase [Alphaproteobacteria bacterium]